MIFDYSKTVYFTCCILGEMFQDWVGETSHASNKLCHQLDSMILFQKRMNLGLVERGWLGTDSKL